MATLEKAILKSARIVLNNPTLKQADILEWSTSEESVRRNLEQFDVMVRLDDPGVWVAVLKPQDRRKP